MEPKRLRASNCVYLPSRQTLSLFPLRRTSFGAPTNLNLSYQVRSQNGTQKKVINEHDEKSNTSPSHTLKLQNHIGFTGSWQLKQDATYGKLTLKGKKKKQETKLTHTHTKTTTTQTYLRRLLCGRVHTQSLIKAVAVPKVEPQFVFVWRLGVLT